MISLFKRKKKTNEDNAQPKDELAHEQQAECTDIPSDQDTKPEQESSATSHDDESCSVSNEQSAEPTEAPNKTGWFKKLRNGLKRTRENFTSGVATLFLGSKTIDDDLFEELETLLLSADVGMETTDQIIEELTNRVSRKHLKDPEALFKNLCQYLEQILEPCSKPLVIDTSAKPYVILMTGINGAGKTTTIGKLAKLFQSQGHKVMLAAGDTFRAAAVEQLQVWGERNNIPVVAQATGSDSASVIYDALSSAKAKGIDILIADTAGRLHTQSNLMAELQKVKRVMGKLDNDSPHEVMLVLDAGIGQNALIQAQEFDKAVGVNGIVITKLDGTAKAGIIFAIANGMKVPIRYIGVGEGIDDLRPFDSKDFIHALFDQNNEK